MWDALRRCRIGIATVAITYLVAIVVGAAMVHAGNAFALETRDSIVTGAHVEDPASRALREGHRLDAALIDFSRNVLLVALPVTFAGLAIVVPYPFVAYRGWVGGIVSVDAAHASRLADPREAAYYVTTLVLQVVPSALTGGAGVALGVAYVRRKPGDRLFLGLPRTALRDVALTYVVALPLFLIASLWEFLAR